MPGQEGRRRRQKRLGFNLPFLIIIPFRKETRGERDRLAENGGSPHPAKEEPPPFLARRMPFCPGRGLICHTGNPLSFEPIKNTAFFERIPFFFSTKWEKIHIFFMALCPMLSALCVFIPCPLLQAPCLRPFSPYCVWHATQWLSPTGRQAGEAFLQTSRTLSQRG